MHEHTHTTQCTCTDPLGTSLSNSVVNAWHALPDTPKQLTTAPVSHELRQCACGCNTYSPEPSQGPTAFDQLDIPVLPIQLDYVDDDDVSDDHQYVSIHVAELANLLTLVRSCTCGQSSN